MKDLLPCSTVQKTFASSLTHVKHGSRILLYVCTIAIKTVKWQNGAEKVGGGKVKEHVAGYPMWQEITWNNIRTQSHSMEGWKTNQPKKPTPNNTPCQWKFKIQREFSLRKFGDRFSSENIGRPINQALERFQYTLTSTSKFAFCLKVWDSSWASETGSCPKQKSSGKRKPFLVPTADQKQP